MSIPSELFNLKIDLDANKGAQESESIKRDIVNVLEQISRFRERVSKYIDDNYVEFLPNNSSVYIHLEEGKNLEQESFELLQSLEWAYTNVELKVTVEALKQSVWDVMVTNRILAADEIFQYIDEANSAKEYMVTLMLLKKLNAFMQDKNVEEVQTLLQANPCYDTIRSKYLSQFHLVKANIREKFQRLLQFSEKQLPNVVCATIQVSKDVNQLQDTLMALFQAQYDISELSDFLMDKCFNPIVCKPVNISFSDESSEYVKLQISHSNVGPTEKHDYKHIFQNIKILFQCLENLNITISEEHHLLGIIGDHIKDRFLKMLIDECLMNAIPATVEEYQSSTLVEDVLQFENFLADLYFIDKEMDNMLGKFAERFEILFRNNYHRSILESGREILRKDLQDMVPLAEKNTPEDVANNPLLFPKCMVSKNVLEFVKLLNRIIRQDSENTEDDNGLHNIISVLINSYINLVPQIHKETLELLPQPAMLFYNNCFFLHHWMAKNFGIPTVASIVKNLSSTGNKYLKKQISKQRDILKNILLSDTGSQEKNKTIAIALVGKCLIHLKLLESLWQHVLPQKIYNRTMGELVGNCCFILNQNVLTKESLNALELKQIIDLMHLFESQVGSLFQDSNELNNINDWRRMKTLLLTLEASLPEISEMWSSSNLSELFKSEEVVHLIRSLYPNTERRALALKKIF